MSDHTADVAAVLAEHQWSHTRTTHCSCGFRTPLAQLAIDGYLAHVAAALLASEPIAQALAAVEAVARVGALADHWRRVGGPDSPKAYADRLRAALRPEGGDQ